MAQNRHNVFKKQSFLSHEGQLFTSQCNSNIMMILRNKTFILYPVDEVWKEKRMFNGVLRDSIKT